MKQTLFITALVLQLAVNGPAWAKTGDDASNGDRRPGSGGYDMGYGNPDDDEDSQAAKEEKQRLAEEKRLEELKRSERRDDNFFDQVTEGNPRREELLQH